jgi:hypothetical protein
MQTSNRLLDDLAKMASGAASTLVGVKQELDALVRQRVERLVAGLDLIGRDEFEAVRALAVNARAEQEKLERRLADLEARLAAAAPGAADAAPVPGAADAPTDTITAG